MSVLGSSNLIFMSLVVIVITSLAGGQVNTATPASPLQLFVSWLTDASPLSATTQVTLFSQKGQNTAEVDFKKFSLTSIKDANVQYAAFELNYSNIIRFISMESSATRSTRFSTFHVVLLNVNSSSTSEDFSNLGEVQFLLGQSQKWNLHLYFVLFSDEDFTSSPSLISATTFTVSDNDNGSCTKYLGLNSNFYIFQRLINATNSAESMMEFAEIYSIKQVPIIQSVVFRKYGLHNFMQSTTTRRQDFRKIGINGVAQKYPGLEWSAEIEVNERSGQVSFISGYNVDEFNYLRDALNFTAVPVQGSGFTGFFANGTIVGMGAQLKNGEADISITTSEMTISRFDHVEFLHTTFPENLYLYFQQLPSSAFRNVYIEAFSFPVWMGIVASLLAFTLCVILIHSVEKRLSLALDRDAEFSQDSLFWSFAIFCQQGWHFSPEAIPLKITMIVGLSISLIVYTAFSASLVSLLSMATMPIKSLDEALVHGLTIYAENHTISARNVMMELQDQGKLPQSKPESENISMYEIDAAEAFNKISSTKSGFITPHLMFIPQVLKLQNCNLSESYICDSLTYVPLQQNPQKSCMFVAKNSPFQEHFNYVIVQMIERGIRHQLFQRSIYTRFLHCMDKRNTQMWQKDSMEVADIYPALILIFSAYVICLVALGAEILVPKFTQPT